LIWRYYIPHAWEPAERMTWADVLLMPDDPSYTGQALFLTVDAVPDNAAEFQLDQDKMDLAVRAVDLSKEECLTWVERWLAGSFKCTGLVAGTLDDFAGRSHMADTITAIRARETSGNS
jgi:hypothetical protein